MSLAVFPSQNAKQEASGPVRNDSITHVSPAAPKALSDMISFTAWIVSSLVVGSKTPFPAASPEAFTTCRSLGISSDSTYARASLTSVKFRYLAVGIPCSCKKSLEKALEASSSAAACVGPNTNTLGHSLARASTSPSTNGASGPTATNLAFVSFVKAMILTLSCFPPGTFSILPPSVAVPPFPGDTHTFDTRGDLAKATARACSRPPPPTTTTTSFSFSPILGMAFWSNSVSAFNAAIASVCCAVTSPRNAAKTSALPRILHWLASYTATTVELSNDNRTDRT
mmetsp:Transcript_5888/g.12254  ORF Transcript_5888/g.12254 Transcript_5888/m.12254 type:complete len:284 (-) Transcript_5888:407-1258(-)